MNTNNKLTIISTQDYVNKYGNQFSWITDQTDSIDEVFSNFDLRDIIFKHLKKINRILYLRSSIGPPESNKKPQYSNWLITNPHRKYIDINI